MKIILKKTNSPTTVAVDIEKLAPTHLYQVGFPVHSYVDYHTLVSRLKHPAQRGKDVTFTDIGLEVSWA